MSLIANEGHKIYSEHFCRYTLYCVTKALFDMHSRDIVHGDVCAANVLCNDKGAVKLINPSTSIALADVSNY